MVLLVTYDLHGPERNYQAIDDVLRTASSWMHPAGSVWFLDSEISTATWRDQLKEAGDANDEFFVVRLTRDWASFNLDSIAANWLKDGARAW